MNAMFSNGNLIVFFILLKYTSFMKFLLAENSTNISLYDSDGNTYSRIFNITLDESLSFPPLSTSSSAMINVTSPIKTTTTTMATTVATTSEIDKLLSTVTKFDPTVAELEIKNLSIIKKSKIEGHEKFSPPPAAADEGYDDEDGNKGGRGGGGSISRIVDSDENFLNDKAEKLQETFEPLPHPEPLFGGGKQQSSYQSQTRQQKKILRQQHQQQQQQQPQQQQQHLPPVATQNTGLPVFPERTDAVYFIVAVIGGAKLWGRSLARTLLDMGPPFGSPMGPPLRPIYLDLPPNGRFSVKVLTSLCQQSDGIPLAGIIVIGDGQAARAIALSGTAMNVPVLWAKGGTANIHGIQQEVQTPLQSLLQPSAREILGAVRALFLQTHWHSFFVLSDVDATIVLTSPEGNSLREAPLQPKILPLPPGDGDVFRQLAEISRSTRGIVLLLCNLASARKIMSEAKRLNMAGGHFIWLWADTSSTTEFFDLHQTTSSSHHDDKIVEYPEAVKQFTAAYQNVDEIGEGLTKHFKDLVERKTDFEDFAVDSSHSSKGNISPDSDGNMKYYYDKQPQQQQKQQEHEQQEQQIYYPGRNNKNNSNIRKETYPGAGRYIFGLNPNGAGGSGGGGNVDDSSEIKSNKKKRDKNDLFEDFDERITFERTSAVTSDEETLTGKGSTDYDTTDEEQQSDEKSFNLFENSAEKFDEDVDNNNNNKNNNNSNRSNFSWPAIFNETIKHANKNLKLKRTSKYYGKNSSTNSHVLFHHFKDFPVGLLALRPIKMPVDRAFIRSAVRLFASTWAKFEEQMDEEVAQQQQQQVAAATSEDFNFQNPNRSNRDRVNPYAIGESGNWPKFSLNVRRDFRERRRQNTFLLNRNRSRRRRQIVHYAETVNRNFSNIRNVNENDVNLRTTPRNLSNVENVNLSATNNNISSSIIISSSSSSSSSSLNYSVSKNSLYNQNLSGLASSNEWSSNESNTFIRDPSLINSNRSKSKRSNTWWSVKEGLLNKYKQQPHLHQKQQQQQQQQQHYWGSIPIRNERYPKKIISYYKGGCFGSASASDIKRAEIFARTLKEATTLALSGHKILDGSYEKPLTTNFELLNLVPDDNIIRRGGTGVGGRSGSVGGEGGGTAGGIGITGTVRGKVFSEDKFDRRRGPRKPVRQLTKWRRVGLISGTNVQLDTIVWPGGDIVVSGMSARAKTVFRIVTALAPPFVMESEQDEDGLCLRGLPCHRLSPTAEHNLTLMFNAIETRDRLMEDAEEHGSKPSEDEANTYDHTLYQTKCCYGLSMDLLDNIATELGFEFHLYLVQDELFGTKYHQHGLNVRERPTATTPDEAVFTRRRQSHRKDKSQRHHYKDKFTSSHYPPQHAGHSYHSASFERKSTLNRNDNNDNDDDDNDDEDDEDDEEHHDNLYEDYKEEVTSDGWLGDKHKQIYRKNINTGTSSRTVNFKKKLSKAKAHWNGIIGDLISGSADMSFAPLSVSRARAEVIDFSAPYFYSGVSWLAAPTSKSEIPLLAFLLPFSPELWIAIFTSLNVTAVAVAIYEWLSPFGLNPWGRQRSKNFSMSSALWVMWGLLCGHLVAFKAPKSWPNKFLINVWGGFSVIFIASYTANIAALIAGLFFHNASNRVDISLLAQRVGAPTASAAETYIKEDQHLWEHMKKYRLNNIEDGIRGLKNGTLDLLLGDTPILDYYRATDPGCTLQRSGDSFVEDTYAIGMTKGFPLKDSISAIIAKYSSNGYLDILTEKWYGELPCFKLHDDIVQPRPLGVEAVAGVFLLLGLGMILGVLILIFEHLFYKYTLPILRHKPKGTVWRSRNIMFFSQKLYRFINCVELVSPHHAARELVHTLRQGQIASLFQKSIKRKEDEQRRRRKSKAQFFEMIQEIRRVQQQERANPKLEVVVELDTSGDKSSNTEPPQKPRSSPKSRLFVNRKENRSRSNSSTLNVRRFSTDSILSERLDTIGRRLSRDLTNSPPDFGKRFETFGKINSSSNEGYQKYDTFSGKNLSQEKIEETKFDTYSGKESISGASQSSEKPPLPVKKHLNKRTPLNSETFTVSRDRDRDRDREQDNKSLESGLTLKSDKGSNGGKIDSDNTINNGGLSTIKDDDGLLHPVCQEDQSTAILRNRLHAEIRAKYGRGGNSPENLEVPRVTTTTATKTTTTTTGATAATSTNSNHHHYAQVQKNRSKDKNTQKEQQQQHHRQRSLDGLDTSNPSTIVSRPPMPIPIRKSENDLDTMDKYQQQQIPPLPPKVSPRPHIKKISLDRLSREDLLKLSESSQSEIHEYLNKSASRESKSEPP